MVDSKSVSGHVDVNVRKQKRAMLTRGELLRSARAIFARDGFEHARLEDIAARAGKTRGAFYDNFKDKEDVFFAIFEENANIDLAELLPVLTDLSTIEKRIEALSEYLSDLCKNRERMLLSLEFKLYAIRHPRKRKRLADLHSLMLLRSTHPELTQLLLQLSGKPADTSLIDCFLISGIMDGLGLNHLFDPDALGSRQLTRYLKLCLRTTLQDAQNNTKRSADTDIAFPASGSFKDRRRNKKA